MTSSRLTQFSNMFAPISVMLSGSVIEVIRLPANAPAGMLETVSGMTTAPSGRETIVTISVCIASYMIPFSMTNEVFCSSISNERLGQFAKALAPISARVARMVTDSSFVQPLNADSPIEVMPGSSSASTRFSQPSNADSPMVRSVEGSTISVSDVQFIKTSSPSSVSPSGRLMETSSSHPLNAEVPSEERDVPSKVTLCSALGAEADVCAKALFPISVTDSGMTMFVMPEFWNAIFPILTTLPESSMGLAREDP